MKQRFLTFLYRRNKAFFEGLLVEDVIGQVPKTLTEPSIEFLAQGKDKLEKWILFNGYTINRRMINDPTRAQIHYGMLIYLKFLLVIVQKTKDKKQGSVAPILKEGDSLEGVDAFINGFNKRTNENSKTA